MDLRTHAEQVARLAHAGVTRANGQAFIDHPAYVANLLAEAGRSPDIQAIGWLHDVVEDTEISLMDLQEAGFPPHVVDAVDDLTKRAGENYFDAVRRAASNPLSRAVKLADNTHNSLTDQLACFDADTRERKILKYRTARQILLAAENELVAA